jgi:hypothetical protein
MCGLPDGVINSEVVDLKERAEHHIDKALEYACRSWYKHFVDVMSSQMTEITLSCITSWRIDFCSG